MPCPLVDDTAVIPVLDRLVRVVMVVSRCAKGDDPEEEADAWRGREGIDEDPVAVEGEEMTENLG